MQNCNKDKQRKLQGLKNLEFLSLSDLWKSLELELIKSNYRQGFSSKE